LATFQESSRDCAGERRRLATPTSCLSSCRSGLAVETASRRCCPLGAPGFSQISTERMLLPFPFTEQHLNCLMPAVDCHRHRGNSAVLCAFDRGPETKEPTRVRGRGWNPAWLSGAGDRCQSSPASTARTTPTPTVRSKLLKAHPHRGVCLSESGLTVLPNADNFAFRSIHAANIATGCSLHGSSLPWSWPCGRTIAVAGGRSET
jgi:hypothetical protein